MQMKTPRFQEAHLGCLFLLQSAQDLLDSSLTRDLRVARFASVRSALAPPGGGGRRDIVDVMVDRGVQLCTGFERLSRALPCRIWGILFLYWELRLRPL